jgi:chemotaxis protein MotB
LQGGLPDDRVLRVQGLANSLLLMPNEPNHPANRRISLIVMTKEAEDRIFRTTSEDLEPPEESNLPLTSSDPAR